MVGTVEFPRSAPFSLSVHGSTEGGRLPPRLLLIFFGGFRSVLMLG